MADTPTQAVCAVCAREQAVKPAKNGRPKSPPKWRRIGSRLLCSQCAGAEYVSRCLTVPVAECVSHPWAEFARAAHAAFARTTAASKQIVRLYALSDPPTPPGEKLARWTAPKETYLEARAVVPELASGSVAALAQRLAGTYNAQRLELHRGDRAIPRVRYPQPVPIRASDYTLQAVGEDLLVSFRLESTAVDDSARYTVRLREKGGFERNGQAIRALLAGEGVLGEMVLDAIRSNGTGRDHPHERRNNGGGNRSSWKYVLRFAAKLPVRRRGDLADSTLHVRTDADGLLVWRVDGQEERPPLHADHIRRQLMRFGRDQARLRNDLKYEKRWPSRVRRKMSQRQNDLATKRLRMLGTFCQQAAAMTAAYAIRRKCRRIEYDDSVRTFAPTFPWHQLAEALAGKCHAEGIEFVASEPRPA